MDQEHGNPRAEAALNYRGLDWSPLPLAPPDDSGLSPGKRPLVAWQPFQDKPPTVAEIAGWWKRWPNANVGVVLGGVSGLVGIDVDSQAGEELVLELSRGDLPRTLEFVTGGEGKRWLYGVPPGHPCPTIPLKGKDGHPVHILGEGSQSVFPPSVHRSGRSYEWVRGHGPGKVAAATAPAWLLAVLKDKAGPQPAPLPQPVCFSSSIDVERARRYLEKCDPAISGQGGSPQTFKIACKLVKGFGLDTETALALMWEIYNPKCVPLWTEKELRHKIADALKTDGQVGYLRDEPMTITPAEPKAGSNGKQVGGGDVHYELAARVRPWPGAPREEAFSGLPGEIVRAIEPESEADPVALLLQLLVVFGSQLGRTAHFRVEKTIHHLNLFAVLVGRTAKGRKGTSFGWVADLFNSVDPTFKDRLAKGLSSSEGLIHAVRDPVKEERPIKEGRQIVGHEEVQTDPGVEDKRLLVMEPEFASVLKQTERAGNTLSQVLRDAWNGGELRILTKNCPMRATGSFIAVVGHITAEELRRLLSATEVASGFANRFLWAAVQRSKKLADGGGNVDLSPFANHLDNALADGQRVGLMVRDEEANVEWRRAYDEELAVEPPGLSGALIARAEAQVMRLACIYALMDSSATVGFRHLRAALALWDYCERSIYYIFGGATGNELADMILEHLRVTADGLTRTAISKRLGGNYASERITEALDVLLRAKLARCVADKGTRPATETWFAENTK